MRVWQMIGWGAVLSCCGTGCGNSASRTTQRSSQHQPSRLVVLIPAVTDIIVALNATDRLVGRTVYDTASTLRAITSVGTPQDPNLEVISKLRPDLVIAWKEQLTPLLASQLRAMGVPMMSMRTSSLEDLRDNMSQLGQLLDRVQAADSMWRAIDGSLGEIARSRARSSSPRVLFLAWLNPIVTAGHGSFVDTLLTIAGGRNAFHDSESAWPLVPIESLYLRDPDVVVVGRSSVLSAADIVADPIFAGLRAVRNRKIREIDGDLLDRPGPRIAEAAARLEQALR